MKKSYLAIAFSLALSLGFTSCADKMTDRQSELKGGDQGPAPAKVHDYLNNGTPANSDGSGHPLAAGKVNTTADTMWNQNSPSESKPF